MEVPFIAFRTPEGRFVIDAYFVEFLSLGPRKTVLIKDPSRENFTDSAADPLPVLLKGDLKNFFRELFEKLEMTSEEVLSKRVSHMRRWSFLRILGIPSGHGRHVATDEILAQVERENSLGLSILKSVLGVKSVDDFDSRRIMVEGVLYKDIRVVSGRIVEIDGREDKVYTNLLKIDPAFRTAFYSAYFRRTFLPKEIEKRAQDFSYSQQAT
ncbi:hypothetical protein [Thermococcus sp. Bubb.Bath]|uniref:hypothetical protein n=1 Tax=Thermococcus sp. Bubb.Bath TaxID=1638242 RepID=UPI00143BB9B0|nr:hypothetical protein [Thermococcus sp. Bubb.Bath]NJF24348.1 hypothetical protein [Thermococcus sp. Bubb.Bath]